MGNCNFKADKDKDSVSGNTHPLTLIAVTKNLFQF